MNFNFMKIVNFNTLLNIYSIWKLDKGSKQFMDTKKGSNI